MDCLKYSTEMAERKKGQHLRMEERGAIKALEKQGLGVRAIARAIGCAPTTVTNELRRGTPARKSTRGRTPSYSPRQGEAVYAANRANCHRPTQTEKCSNFIEWGAHKSGNTNGHWMHTYCFRRFAALANLQGETVDGTRFRALAGRTARYLDENLWDSERKAFCDSWSPKTGLTRCWSVQTHTLLVLYDAIDDPVKAAKARQYLLDAPEDFI